MEKISNKKIHVTDEYWRFVKLEGNRPITDRRTDKIMQSILKIGYVTSPILVNEDMEVIDGQGRLSALERLGLPVEYIIHEGAGVEECIQMNINQSDWKDYDYVCCYAIRGDENYQRLQSLLDSYNLPTDVVCASALGINAEGTSAIKKIRTGVLDLPKSEHERAKWECSYAEQFRNVAKSIGGRKFPFYMATIYAYRHLNSEGRNHMADVIKQKRLEFPSLSRTSGYLKYFDDFYNEGKRKNRINLHLEWQIEQEGRKL